MQNPYSVQHPDALHLLGMASLHAMGSFKPAALPLLAVDSVDTLLATHSKKLIQPIPVIARML